MDVYLARKWVWGREVGSVEDVSMNGLCSTDNTKRPHHALFEVVEVDSQYQCHLLPSDKVPLPPCSSLGLSREAATHLLKLTLLP